MIFLKINFLKTNKTVGSLFQNLQKNQVFEFNETFREYKWLSKNSQINPQDYQIKIKDCDFETMTSFVI